MPFIIGVDQRQHINLSEHAWTKIEEDMTNFTDATNTRGNVSGFVNTVFKNYYMMADASIVPRLENYEERLESLFRNQKFASIDSSIRRMFINQLKSKYQKDLLQKARNYPKGVSNKIRLNNHNYDVLTLESPENEYYEGSSGYYVKAVLEEYVRKAYHKREQIVFKPVVDVITEALNRKQQLKVKLKKGVFYHVSPYAIVTDKTNVFNYLVGYANDKMVSFRLSKIDHIRILESKRGNISKIKEKQLKSTLANHGPQFLAGNLKHVVVQLTKNGQKKYNQQIHLRPATSKIVDNEIYHFHCTELQALFYFFKFGRDATILEPMSLRNRFKHYYETALENYQ